MREAMSSRRRWKRRESVQRRNGRSEGRGLRAQALLTDFRIVAGPATSPVEAEEIVAAGATAVLHVSRPRQAPLGPRCFAFIHGPRRAHRGPGGYCRHSGNQGTTGRPARAHYIVGEISLRTRRSKPNEPCRGIFPSTRDLSSRGRQAEGLARLSASRGFILRQGRSVPATERTWAQRSPQSHRRAKAR